MLPCLATGLPQTQVYWSPCQCTRGPWLLPTSGRNSVRFLLPGREGTEEHGTSVTPSLCMSVCACMCVCLCVHALVCMCVCVCVLVHTCVCVISQYVIQHPAPLVSSPYSVNPLCDGSHCPVVLHLVQEPHQIHRPLHTSINRLHQQREKGTLTDRFIAHARHYSACTSSPASFAGASVLFTRLAVGSSSPSTPPSGRALPSTSLLDRLRYTIPTHKHTTPHLTTHHYTIPHHTMPYHITQHTTSWQDGI